MVKFNVGQLTVIPIELLISGKLTPQVLLALYHLT